MTRLRLIKDDEVVEEKVEKILTPEEERLLKATGVHPVVAAKVCPTMDFQMVPDIANASHRKRKYALVVGFNGIPNFHERLDPLIVPSEMDSFLIDADSLEDMRARCIRELDNLLAQMKEVAEKIDEINRNG